jgi:hypothetical protein
MISLVGDQTKQVPQTIIDGVTAFTSEKVKFDAEPKLRGDLLFHAVG